MVGVARIEPATAAMCFPPASPKLPTRTLCLPFRARQEADLLHHRLRPGRFHVRPGETFVLAIRYRGRLYRQRLVPVDPRQSAPGRRVKAQISCLVAT